MPVVMSRARMAKNKTEPKSVKGSVDPELLDVTIIEEGDKYFISLNGSVNRFPATDAEIVLFLKLTTAKMKIKQLEEKIKELTIKEPV